MNKCLDTCLSFNDGLSCYMFFPQRWYDLALLNRFKPSSKIFYWPFQCGTSFVDLLCFCFVLCLLCFVRVCLYVLCGHLLGKGWPLGSRLWCLLWFCHFPIDILGQVWYLIVSIPDLCTLTYFDTGLSFDAGVALCLSILQWVSWNIFIIRYLTVLAHACSSTKGCFDTC